MAKSGGAVDHDAIEKRAATWLARRDRGDWSREDDADLAEWLNETTAHRVAFLRLEKGWEEARRARVLSPYPARPVPPAGEWRKSPFFGVVRLATGGNSSRAHVWRRWSAAACFALIIGLGITGYLLDWLGRGNVYRTGVGVIASIPLADGSVVTLNTASRIRVDFQPKERRVVLESGEAYFVVKRNPVRPFVVIAGNQRIVDVGTQFSVWKAPGSIQVIVTEGAVKLESLRDSLRPTAGAFPVPRLKRLAEIDVPLNAGTVAIAQGGDLLVQKESVRSVEDMVSWREGYLTFNDTTLADAVADFNRYNTRHISIQNPEVAGIRISGTFAPTNYEAFVRLLHEGYGISVRESGGSITLTEK